jgi:hypothetical protein
MHPDASQGDRVHPLERFGALVGGVCRGALDTGAVERGVETA